MRLSLLGCCSKTRLSEPVLLIMAGLEAAVVMAPAAEATDANEDVMKNETVEERSIKDKKSRNASNRLSWLSSCSEMKNLVSWLSKAVETAGCDNLPWQT